MLYGLWLMADRNPHRLILNYVADPRSSLGERTGRRHIRANQKAAFQLVDLVLDVLKKFIIGLLPGVEGIQGLELIAKAKLVYAYG